VLCDQQKCRKHRTGIDDCKQGNLDQNSAKAWVTTLKLSSLLGAGFLSGFLLWSERC